MRIASPRLVQDRGSGDSFDAGQRDAWSGGCQGEPGEGGYGTKSGAMGGQRREILLALHADDGLFAQVAESQLHDAEAGDRVEQYRQHGDHEERCDGRAAGPAVLEAR